ncbi:hypothetical protein BH11BAC1_BH11BAC1_10680 [soil metagenome]
MNPRIIFSILILILFFGTGKTSSGFSGPSKGVYAALQSDDTSKINAQLIAIESTSWKEKDAYAGALTMKKSGLVKSGLEKLSLFKKGRVRLEASIKQDSANIEYRFLRLLIQENVPDFLNYHSKKTEDSRLIRDSFLQLPADLQQLIRDYSKKSKVLKPEDFQK